MPAISTISPSTFDDGKSVTLTGSGFGSSQGSVLIGGVAQNVNTWSDTSITFTTVRGSQSLGACRVDVVGGGAGASYSGGVLTLNGSFPTKATAAPVYSSDFESYSAGASVATVGLEVLGDAGVPVNVSAVRAYAGTKSLRCDYQAGSAAHFPKIGLSGLSLDEIYMSCNFYWERYTTGGEQTIIFKLSRAGSGTVYSGRPQFYETIRPNFTTGVIASIDRGFVTDLAGTTYLNTNSGKADRDAWHRLEYRYKLSTPGTGNGALQTYVDYVANANSTTGVTRSSADTTDEKINWVLTPFDGMDRVEDSAYYAFVDNLYIDATPVRVEVGNASTLAACTERVVAVPTAWSTTNITANLNTATLGSGTRWVFVFDENNVQYGSALEVVL